MLWSQELPAYSYTHRLGSLSMFKPRHALLSLLPELCPFYQSSAWTCNCAQTFARHFETLTSFWTCQQFSTWQKSWPLTGHWKSQGHYMPLPKYLQHQRLQKTCLPSWWVVLHGDYQQAHATQQTPSQGASRRSHLKTGFPLQNALIKTYMNSCSLVTNLCRSMALTHISIFRQFFPLLASLTS